MIQFDVEQQILDCWAVTNDIDVVVEAIRREQVTSEQVVQLLVGISSLQQLKFDKLFLLFSQMVDEGRKQ